MLYADKRALETNLQVSLLKIREKELQFYTQVPPQPQPQPQPEHHHPPPSPSHPPRPQNCIAIGTQAALLSGFAYNGIIQVDIPSEANDWLKTLYLCVTTAAMGFELIAVLNSTLCSMLGPGLALRGPDGSMHRAVDGLMLEYRLTFLFFTMGYARNSPASSRVARVNAPHTGLPAPLSHKRARPCVAQAGLLPPLGAALRVARVLMARGARDDARPRHVHLR